jgi:hypothetical protein
VSATIARPDISGTPEELRVRAAAKFSEALDCIIASGMDADKIREIVGHFNDWCSIYTMANVHEAVQFTLDELRGDAR